MSHGKRGRRRPPRSASRTTAPTAQETTASAFIMLMEMAKAEDFTGNYFPRRATPSNRAKFRPRPQFYSLAWPSLQMVWARYVSGISLVSIRRDSSPWRSGGRNRLDLSNCRPRGRCATLHGSLGKRQGTIRVPARKFASTELAHR